MTIKRTTINTGALPLLLLPTMKAQARVEHARDDALITGHTAAAIAMVERQCNVSLNPAVYEVTTDELAWSSIPRGTSRASWQLPLNNVRSFVVTNGADDISADFELWQQDFGGSASAYVTAAGSSLMNTAALLTLTVGVLTPPALSPAFLSVIGRMVASMYENREANSALWVDGFAAELFSMWRPCA
ncbi:MAG TPA: head-tail connector protein [Burkholderiaceae bacterium]|nr:head-tail connector protein [Burkholderiaceae bacterium]